MADFKWWVEVVIVTGLAKHLVDRLKYAGGYVEKKLLVLAADACMGNCRWESNVEYKLRPQGVHWLPTSQPPLPHQTFLRSEPKISHSICLPTFDVAVL